METADFGALLLERKQAAGVWFAIGWPLAALLGVGGYLVLDRDVTVAAVLWGLAGLCVFVPLVLPARKTRFHETGLTVTTPLRAQFALPYDRIELMTWQSFKPSVGTTVRATLRGGGRRLDFMWRMDTGGQRQQAVERVRDQIASRIAVGLHAVVRSGQPLAWGTKRDGSVRIGRDGLAYRPMGFLGAGEERLVPWATGFDYAFRNGFFSVFPSGATEALFTLACESPDFYPCFLVFSSMGAVRAL